MESGKSQDISNKRTHIFVDPAPWAVYANGSLWGHSGRDRPGREVPVGLRFAFGPLEGVLPAVYLCGGGLVLDVCLSVSGEEAAACIRKILAAEDREQQWKIAEDFPLRQGQDPDTVVTLNGHRLRHAHGSSAVWYPEPPEGEENSAAACRAAAHYGLDPRRTWVIIRSSFRWHGKRRPARLRSLTVALEPEEQDVPGPEFPAEAGDRVDFTDSVTGTGHVLTVLDAAWEQLDLPEGFGRPGLEYPRWCRTLTYTVEPELPAGSFRIRDTGHGDRPRGTACAAEGTASVGVIGGADGPTAIFLSDEASSNGKSGGPRRRGVCSSLYFDPPETLTWRVSFRRRPWDGVDLDLSAAMKEVFP